MRYEDDFGSFWMVDDNEFVKRRHLSRGRPRKYDPNTADDQRESSQSQSQQQSTNQTASSNVNQAQHSKAPIGTHGGSTSKYNDHSNAMQPNATHLMQNVTTNLGQPSNGINHHYFSSPVPPTQ